MSKQPEALRLADELEEDWHKAKKSGQVLLSSAAELRRLHAANVELLAACKTTIPSGICLTNKNVPDDLVVPVDFTMGEIRKMAAAIAKHGGQS